MDVNKYEQNNKCSDEYQHYQRLHGSPNVKSVQYLRVSPSPVINNTVKDMLLSFLSQMTLNIPNYVRP